MNLLRSSRLNVEGHLLRKKLSSSLPDTRCDQTKSIFTIPLMTESINHLPLNPNDFKIENASMDNFDLYFDLMSRFFYPREQLSTGLHVNPIGLEDYRRKQLRERISSGASICAIYKPTNQVAGSIFGNVLTRANPYGIYMEEVSKLCKELQYLTKILIHMQEKSKLFEDPEVEKVLELSTAVVRPEFSRNKLFERLTEQHEALGVELGCQIVASQASTAATQHVLRKLGFEEMHRVQYETLEINGKRVMDLSVLNGASCVIAFRKSLQK